MNGSQAQLLDAYLDGLLSVDARATFESELEHSPALQEQIAVQRMINTSLRKLFAAPAFPEPLAGVLTPATDVAERKAAMLGARPGNLRRILTVAAGLAIAALAIYRLSDFLTAPKADSRYERYPQQAMDAFYNRKIAEGFVPEWRCESDQEFVRTFQHQLYQPLLLMTPPPGHQMGGLGYANILSPYSVYMVAHAGEERVIVFVDRLEADQNLPPLTDPELKRFRREIGELVLYELTPLDEARFLPLFEVPQP